MATPYGPAAPFGWDIEFELAPTLVKVSDNFGVWGTFNQAAGRPCPGTGAGKRIEAITEQTFFQIGVLILGTNSFFEITIG